MKKLISLSGFGAAVLLGLSLGVGRWLKADPAPLGVGETANAAADVDLQSPYNIPSRSQPQAADSRNYAYRLPGMECLVSPYGIRRKVLVTQQNVRCLSEPGGAAAAGPQLRFFMPYFVFDVFPPQGEIAFYHVGSTPQRASIIGWVSAAQVAAWDTRVGARYHRSPSGRTPPLLVYQNPEALEELVKNNATEQQPMARAAHDGARTFMPWPISEVRQYNHEGRVYELLRLNFLGEHQLGGSLQSDRTANKRGRQYTAAEVGQFKRGVRMLDLVFCMDTTASTTPHIAAMRESVRAIASRLQELPFQPDLSCGLVLYRDYVDAIMFDDGEQPSPVKFYPLETDLQAFLSNVERVEEAKYDSEEASEAVYDGMLTALTRPQWRGEGLAARVVVLIGDNSAHEAGHAKNPANITSEQLLRIARADGERGIKIFSLCVDGQGDTQERQRHERQFRELARGAGGECFRLDEAVKVVDRVKAILEAETAVVHTRSVVLDELAAGKTKDKIAAEKQLDVRQVAEVMEFLEGGGIDLERLKPGVPAFASGWCLAELDGVPLLDREAYIARAELDMLLSELNSLCVQLSPNFGTLAFQKSLGSRIDPLSFFAERRPEPMDVFLMAQGVPCSQGLLKLTRSEIEHMSEERRAVLRERIARQVVPQLTNARNNDQYFTWLNELEFGWVDESHLP